MYLYNINKLRRKILPLNLIKDNQDIYQFLSFKTMIENFPFQYIYLDKKTYGTYLDQKQVIDFLNFLDINFNYKININIILNIKNNIEDFKKIEYFDLRDLNKKINQHKPQKKIHNPLELKEKNKTKYKKHLLNIIHINKFNKVLSLDFEFKDDLITEAGLSFYFPKSNKLVHNRYF